MGLKSYKKNEGKNLVQHLEKNYPLYTLFIIILFLGYSIGRIGHIVGGSTYGLHHWILASAIILISLPLCKSKIGKMFLFFGLGLFFSDFIDVIHFRVIGKDVVSQYVFWGFD